MRESKTGEQKEDCVTRASSRALAEIAEEIYSETVYRNGPSIRNVDIIFNNEN